MRYPFWLLILGVLCKVPTSQASEKSVEVPTPIISKERTHLSKSPFLTVRIPIDRFLLQQSIQDEHLTILNKCWHQFPRSAYTALLGQDGEPPLTYAISENKKQIALFLLTQKEIDYNQCSRDGTTALQRSIEEEMYEVTLALLKKEKISQSIHWGPRIKSLQHKPLKKKYDPKATPAYELFPLLALALKKQWELMYLLLEIPSLDVNQQEAEKGRNLFSVLIDHPIHLKKCLDKKRQAIDLTRQDSDGDTLLFSSYKLAYESQRQGKACFQSSIAYIIEEYMRYGSPIGINLPNKANWTVFTWLVVSAPAQTLKHYLKALTPTKGPHPVNDLYPFPRKEHAYVYLSGIDENKEQQALKKLKILMDYFPLKHMNTLDNNGVCALWNACFYTKKERIAWLIKKGVSVNVFYKKKKLLYGLYIKKAWSLIKFLLEEGVSDEKIDGTHDLVTLVCREKEGIDRLLKWHPSYEKKNKKSLLYKALLLNEEELARSILQEEQRRHWDITVIPIALFKGGLNVASVLFSHQELCQKQQNLLPYHLLVRQKNRSECIKRLAIVNKGGYFDPNKKDKDGITPLVEAIRHNHLSALKFLAFLPEVDVNQKYHGTSLLFDSVKENKQDFVRILLQAGASLLQEPILCYAVKHRRELMVKEILSHVKTDKEPHPCLEIADVQSFTPLIAAAFEGNLHLYQLLLEAGADYTAKGPADCAAIFLALGGCFETLGPFQKKYPKRKTAYRKIIHYTLEYLASKKGAPFLELTTPNGQTLLWEMAFYGEKSWLEKLIQCKSHINAQDILGMSPLSAAVAEGHLECTKRLLDHGADPNIGTKEGYTPIFFALKQGHMKIIPELLKHKAKIVVFSKEKKHTVNNMIWETYKTLLEYQQEEEKRNKCTKRVKQKRRVQKKKLNQKEDQAFDLLDLLLKYAFKLPMKTYDDIVSHPILQLFGTKSSVFDHIDTLLEIILNHEMSPYTLSLSNPGINLFLAVEQNGGEKMDLLLNNPNYNPLKWTEIDVYKQRFSESNMRKKRSKTQMAYQPIFFALLLFFSVLIYFILYKWFVSSYS